MSGETILNGRYRLTAQQGSGGMAVIYKATDQALGRTVAVKILRPSLTTDPTFIARFQNEARSIANLAHPNIVTVHDVGSDGPTHYIVMEFVEGDDLKKVIRTYGALSVERALNLAVGICAGIGFAHRARIVHADIKPQNILLTSNDDVKITDFGIAQALSDTQPAQRQSVVWGSPHYFAPEQARGEKPTAASDVYSIGIVMFEMLTGRLPYVGTNQQELAMAHIRDRIPTVTEFNPSVPETLSRIIFKAMSKEPGDRFRMADQLGNILRDYRDQGRQNTLPGGTPQVSNRPATAPTPAEPTVPRQAVPPASGPQGSVPPPASPYQPPRQGTPPPPGMPPGGLPTQRYSPAPQPPTPAYRGPSIQSPTDSRPLQGQPAAPDLGRSRQFGDSRPMAPHLSQSARAREPEPRFTLDGVTIALAVMAFMAVACLIPLYLAVWQARFG